MTGFLARDAAGRRGLLELRPSANVPGSRSGSGALCRAGGHVNMVRHPPTRVRWGARRYVLPPSQMKGTGGPLLSKQTEGGRPEGVWEPLAPEEYAA